MAYSITGDISFKLFFVHDNEVGNNGKTLGNVLHKNLLGPFALEAKDFLFLQKGTKDAGVFSFSFISRTSVASISLIVRH